MGFDKAIGKRDNETMAWQKQEREYIQSLCKEQGIEIETLGVKRDNYTLPEYKEAIKVTSELQEQVVKMRKQVKKDKLIVDKYDLKAESLKKVEQALKEEEKGMKGVAVPIKGFLRNEEYVKIKKDDWEHILEAYKWAKGREKLLNQYEDIISEKNNIISKLETSKKNCLTFLSKLGLIEKFNEFISPKSIRKELKNKQEQVENQKKVRLPQKQEQPHKNAQIDI